MHHFYNIQKSLIWIVLRMKTMKIIKKCPYLPDYPYRMLIIRGSDSGKTNVLLKLIKEQDSGNLDDKIYLYAKDLNERKYQFFH